MKKIIFSLFCLVVLLTICNSRSHAVDLWPMQVGSIFEYAVYDSADPQNNWTMRAEALNTVTIGSFDYFNIGITNEYRGGSYAEFPVRSTETEVYFGDRLNFQLAPVGTIWSYAESGGGQTFTEIISIEPVTVPFGTFSNAYVHRNYYDPDDPAEPNSPYFYQYVVPDVGMVKIVDYWVDIDNAPTTFELVNVSVAPEPVSSTLFIVGGATLGFRRFRKKFKK